MMQPNLLSSHRSRSCNLNNVIHDGSPNHESPLRLGRLKIDELNDRRASESQSSCSASSNEMDASLILSHPVSEEKIRAIKDKSKFKTTRFKSLWPNAHEFYIGESRKKLQKGIRATKLNFSNTQTKEVRLWLSSDVKTLMYETIDSESTQRSLWQKIKGSSKVALS